MTRWIYVRLAKRGPEPCSASLGLYEFTVKVKDEEGKESEVSREAAVHGTNGFSGFGEPALEDYWRLANVRPRGNFSPDTWYSLDDVPGWLEVQVLDYTAKPLAKSFSTYPFISRKLPENRLGDADQAASGLPSIW